MRVSVKFAFHALATIAVLASALAAQAQQDVITTVVGNGPNNIPALDADLYYPQQLAIDSQGNVYVADYYHSRVFKFSSGGNITLIAGTGTAGYSGDGGLATKADLYYPQGVAVDSANPANVYIADTNNCLVRKVTASTGIITTVAGLVTTPTGSAPYSTCGYAGDGGKANAAELYEPVSLAVNPGTGDLYIADHYNGRVRKVTGGFATGEITTVAGGGGSTTTANNCGGTEPFGDTGAATGAYLCYPAGVALDTSVSPANVFISDSQNCVVREVVGSSGKIYQIAGSYTLGCGFTDGVKATSGQFYYPQQLAVQVSGGTTSVEVADFDNYRYRKFTLTYSSAVPTPGTITTIAGDGSGYSGDGGPALSAGITQPVGLAFDSAGDYYVAGQSDDRVRKVLKSTGYINTVAGWGSPYYSDPIGVSDDAGGGVALYLPSYVFADPLSTKIYIGGYQGEADYVWDSSTTEVSDLAGNGVAGYAGDGTAANGPGTELYYPEGIVKDSSGNVYIADSENCVIREVSASTGKISTIVGGSNGEPNGCGYSGDGGAATSAQIYLIHELAIDSANNLYLVDFEDCLVRKVTASTGIITTVAGLVTTVDGVKTAANCGYSGDGGSALSAELSNATGVAVDSSGNIYIADYYNQRIRKVDAVTGTINTVAGDGGPGYTGDGPATQNSLYYPTALSSDVNGNLFIADYDNEIVRWVDPAGWMTTFGGTPRTAGFGGDGGVATSALLYLPYDVTQDSGGNFYVADSYNDLIRKITAFAGYGRSTASLSFGNQASGTTSEYQSVYLSAIGPVTIDSITTPTGFSEIDDCAGSSLTAGQTCEIDVFFAPTKTGTAEGLLSISSNAFFPSQANTIDLSGRGIGLTLSGSLNFFTVLLKTAVTNTVTLTNSGNFVTLSKLYLTETTDFSISGGTCKASLGLATGASCTIEVTFDPQTIFSKKSTLVIASNDPSSPLLAGATGTGSEVKLSATSLAFPTTTFGNSETLDLTVTNLGTSTLTITPVISGSGAGSFEVLTTSANTCKSGVAAGASCTLPVLFDPSAVGSFAATLTLDTNGGSNPAVALSGSDTTAVTVSPTSLSFPTITHATKETLTLTVNNVGASGSPTLTVSPAISGTGEAAFSITGNTCTSGVAAGKSCALTVQFDPPAAESYSATLTVTTNGGSNPAVPLSGTGK